ncbi:hypothetical protein JMJ35_004778 [Cladonia borealis]|uniref:Uncharacterized protein n=1 Tax=Cladonia borealis TaxID=184061 RepID=A0AA39R2D4_9LECA|nr:hypothetical protein JMJ35_004778 [Cladonia borealis]
MARNAETVPYRLNLWQKLVLLPYIANIPQIFAIMLEYVGLVCWSCAATLSTRSSWLSSTPLPNYCYLISHMNTLLQLQYILAAFRTVLVPVNSVAFAITILRRETTCTDAFLYFGLIAVSTVVAAVVLALQIVVQNSSLDMQAILRIRPDLSSEEVLNSWEFFTDITMPLTGFILFLLASGLEIVAVSARHLIPYPARLPRQFRPFVAEEHKRARAFKGPEASTLGTELVARLDPGPLARLFDDYEKRALISTHTDLEVCQSNIAIVCRYLHDLHSLSTEKTLRKLS